MRDRAATIVGDAAAVDAFVSGREVLHRESLGRVSSVTVLGALDRATTARGSARPDSRPAPVSLQQLIVRTHPARRWRSTATTDEGLRDEPHTQRRPHAADQPEDLHLDAADHPGRALSCSRSLIYAMIPAGRPEVRRRSAGAALVLLRVGIQALTLTLPVLAGDERHASGVLPRHAADGRDDLGHPRVVFVIGGFIEQATNGYGMNGYFFYLDWLWAPGRLGALACATS